MTSSDEWIISRSVPWQLLRISLKRKLVYAFVPFFFSFPSFCCSKCGWDGWIRSSHLGPQGGHACWKRSNESDFLKTSFHQLTVPTQKLLVSHWKQVKTLALICLALGKLENALQSHFPPSCPHKHAELFAVLEFIIQFLASVSCHFSALCFIFSGKFLVKTHVKNLLLWEDYSLTARQIW